MRVCSVETGISRDFERCASGSESGSSGSVAGEHRPRPAGAGIVAGTWKVDRKVAAGGRITSKKRIEKQEIERAIALLPPARESVVLEATLALVLQSGNLEQQLAQGCAELLQLKHRADAELKKLGLWTGSMELVEALSLPLDQSIEQARNRIEKANGERDLARTEIRKLEKKLRETDRKIAELSATGGCRQMRICTPPGRIGRRVWALIRKAWLGVDTPGADEESFAKGSSLDHAYSQSVAHADELADRLRTESGRVADLANANLERIVVEGDVDRQRLHLADIETSIAEIEKDWISLWQRLASRQDRRRKCLDG